MTDEVRETEDLQDDHEIAMHLVARFYKAAYPDERQPRLSVDEWTILNRALQGA